MHYGLVLVLLFLTSFNTNLFSASNTLTSDRQIKVLLENDISPNSSIGRRVVLLVEEDVKNNTQDKVIIPRYTRIICKQSEVKRLEKVDAIFVSCDKLFLPNGKTIDFRGNVFSTNLKAGITTNKNVTVPKNTKLIVKPEGSFTIN